MVFECCKSFWLFKFLVGANIFVDVLSFPVTHRFLLLHFNYRIDERIFPFLCAFLIRFGNQQTGFHRRVIKQVWG